MSSRPFPSRSRKHPLRAWPGKLVCLLALLILAGCAGSKRSNLQTAHGTGFRFQAPLTWTIKQTKTSTAATHGKVDRLEVLRFKLLKPYRPALFAAASRELDAAIARIATQLKGRIASRETVQLAGRKARSYRIVYGPGKTQEIAFVLNRQTEYELLCRRPSGQSDATCQAFFGSFALG